MNVKNLANGTRVTVKVNDVTMTATFEGFSEKYNLPYVRLADGRKILRKIYGIVDAVETTRVRGLNGLLTGGGREDFSIAPIDGGDEVASLPEVEPSRYFDINQRFDFIERLVRMVCGGPSTSLIISGQGGLGKTFTVKQTLAASNLVEGEHYVMIKGHSTPKALFRTLYENNDMIVIFDDCDSVLRNDTAINILKAALDTEPVRTISWMSEAAMGEEDLPKQFEFTGKVIFLTNVSVDRVPQPLLSRSQIVDVSMTADEKITRIRGIVADIRTDVSLEVKTEVVDFLHNFRHRAKDLNIRTLLKVIDIRLNEPTVWRDLAEYSVTI